MLRELHIANLAIIDDQTLSFGTGLNVLTGETGSGKSIILAAMELLLGGRGSAQLIREGADTLEVQGIFELGALPIQVREAFPEIAQGDDDGEFPGPHEVCLARVLTRTGKGRAYINGRLATVAMLQEVAGAIISLCGQNQHVRLLSPSYHRELLDRFAGLEEKLRWYQGKYRAWREVVRELGAVELASSRHEERARELTEIVRELEEGKLKVGERAEIEGVIKRLANGEQVLTLGQGILDGLRSEGGIEEQLTEIGARFQELARLDPEIAPFARAFQGGRVEIAECGGDLERHLARSYIDEDELERLRERLSIIARLERKYRLDEGGLLDLLQRSGRELAELEGGTGLERLRAQASKQEQEVRALAEDLTRERRTHGTRLAREAAKELKEVALGDARLEVAVETADLGMFGGDSVELLVATNRGEGTKPLRLVASGGELARITLVLKTLLREQSGVNVLVFDEVDTGISGGVARAVGLKLRGLATCSQVICVTHLPQVASLADTHLMVSKVRGSKRTTVKVECLKGPQKVEEIARMLAGYEVTDAARASARELLSSNS